MFLKGMNQKATQSRTFGLISTKILDPAKESNTGNPKDKQQNASITREQKSYEGNIMEV